MTARWTQIIALWLIGVLAAAQLAKMAVLAPALRLEFGFSLSEAGLLVSLMEVGGALFGFGAGILIGRLGSRRFLLAGLLLLAITGTLQAGANSKEMLLAARAFEGVGYVFTAVAAPTMIIATAAEHERGAALALWSTFVALGLALGSAITGLLAGFFSSSVTLLAWAVLAALAFVMARQFPPVAASKIQGTANKPAALDLPAWPAWVSTVAFGFYTAVFCTITALLPTFLVEQLGASLPSASGLAGAVSAAALPGCFAVMAIMRAPNMRPGTAKWLAAIALLASALPVALVFSSDGGEANTVFSVVLLAALSIMLGGLTIPFILARLPVLAGARTGHDPRVAGAQGLVTQLGAGGALLGPPFAGLIVEAYGWTSLGLCLAAMTVIVAILFVGAELGLTRPTENSRMNGRQSLPHQ